ncbi:unnamed protein product [Pleuronectes platessa]|uniref:Uncharacterized protein n=1 Tax=Pleuronectes platessa TaxID=8262 RepID=A0A9N7VSL3_PLEPL|nr:unnamed protein product [Pleuronectes platessa]
MRGSEGGARKEEEVEEMRRRKKRRKRRPQLRENDETREKSSYRTNTLCSCSVIHPEQLQDQHVLAATGRPRAVAALYVSIQSSYRTNTSCSCSVIHPEQLQDDHVL